MFVKCFLLVNFKIAGIVVLNNSKETLHCRGEMLG